MIIEDNMLGVMSFIIIGGAIALGFFAQTVTGFAAGIIALPFLLFAFPLQDASALLSIYMLSFSIILVAKDWRSIDKKTVMYMGAGVIPGLIIGVYLLSHVDTEILKKILGAFILIYASSHWLFRNRKKFLPEFKQTGFAIGFIGGIFSGLYSGGSAIYAIHIVKTFKEAKVIRATIIAVLAIANSLRVPLLVANGILTWDIAKIALIVAPVFLLSLYAGDKIHHKLNDKIFGEIVTGLLAFAAIMLLIG